MNKKLIFLSYFFCLISLIHGCEEDNENKKVIVKFLIKKPSKRKGSLHKKTSTQTVGAAVLIIESTESHKVRDLIKQINFEMGDLPNEKKFTVKCNDSELNPDEEIVHSPTEPVVITFTE